eukprot:TRINITY_DN30262_c0_g1_i2.p1 TRINITY_DN30262_c0_g1~~TRINITY_DN30262_c0_g1_i2.p1  ORF type:complete len:322 (+),score=84.77 TRINITY_DN30262_c0_g1_i2:50-967(+)
MDSFSEDWLPPGAGGSSSSSASAPASQVIALPLQSSQAGGDSQMVQEDASIDDLMKLIDARDHDVDDLLGCLAPVKGSPKMSASAAPASPGSSKGWTLLEEGQETPAQEVALLPDLPDPEQPIPSDVVAVPFITVAKFSLKCEVDLKKVAFGLRHAEYNPRKHTSITVRLFDPKATALVRASGIVQLSSSAVPGEELKRSAKKLARLVQRCGHEEAKFADYKVTSILCKADLKFPVRLEALASRFRKNALYEPEFFCSCVFRTRKPRCTYLVTAGGKVSISGLKTMTEVEEALRRAYFVFREFRT